VEKNVLSIPTANGSLPGKYKKLVTPHVGDIEQRVVGPHGDGCYTLWLHQAGPDSVITSILQDAVDAGICATPGPIVNGWRSIDFEPYNGKEGEDETENDKVPTAKPVPAQAGTKRKADPIPGPAAGESPPPMEPEIRQDASEVYIRRPDGAIYRIPLVVVQKALEMGYGGDLRKLFANAVDIHIVVSPDGGVTSVNPTEPAAPGVVTPETDVAALRGEISQILDAIIAGNNGIGDFWTDGTVILYCADSNLHAFDDAPTFLRKVPTDMEGAVIAVDVSERLFGDGTKDWARREVPLKFWKGMKKLTRAEAEAYLVNRKVQAIPPQPPPVAAALRTAIVKQCHKGDGEAGKPWCLYAHDGKLLGRHPTQESAYKQEAAIKSHGG
jgi:hypothetical protein